MAAFSSPVDWRDVWIYFLLVDRFDNPGAPPRHQWDDPYGGFQGGTFDGVIERLDFLADLGAGAVWLSPVLANVPYEESYHGYGIADFARVEPRLCADPDRARSDPAYADAQLRAVVDAAHQRGLYVIFDVVLNHAGDVFAYDGFGGAAPWRDGPPYPLHWRGADGQPNPDWPTAPADVPPGAAVAPASLRRDDAFRRLGNAFDAPPDHDPASAGDFFTLKELVTDLQDDQGRYPVRDALTNAYADLIRRFDVDGFRIDTLMYVEPDFARWFGNAMREQAAAFGKSNFFTFGEVYSDEARISAYVGRHAGAGGDLVGVDAALDFPLFYVLPPIAKAELAPTALTAMYALRRSLEDGVISSHGDATRYFVTFLDNHDQHERFTYGDPADPGNPYAAQASLGLAALMTLPGIPCVYYGTEAGLHGGGDAPEAVRQALWGAPRAFDPTTPSAATLAELTALRSDQPALRYGRQYFRPVSGDGRSYGLSPFPGGIVAWSRILADSEVVVVANTSTAQAWSGHVVVDAYLSGPAPAPAPTLLYSNQPAPVDPASPVDRPSGSVNTDDGVNQSLGPIRTVAVSLAPMEIQVFTTTG